jgi:hypothetical protein
LLKSEERHGRREVLKRITEKQAELIATIHKILQGEYGEESRMLLYNRLLVWARAEKLKRRGRPESNKSRKKKRKKLPLSQG